MTSANFTAPRARLPLFGLSPRWIVLVLVLLALVTRLPFRTQYLFHWDSVNYAFALEKFDVYHHQPHPPGYLLYIALARGINAMVGDANLTFVSISIVAGALALAVLFLLAAEMFGTRVALWASALLLTSPLFWFYSEVAVPYTLDVALALVIVWSCYRVTRGSQNAVWLAAGLLGLAGGIRPQTTIVLFPLWLYVSFALGWRKWLAALLLVGIGALVWFLPLVYLSNGLENYLSLLAQYSQALRGLSPLGSPGNFVANLARLGGYLFYAYPLGLFVFAWGAVAWLRARCTYKPDASAIFLLLWIVPPLLFYLLVLLQQPGYITIILPPLAIVLARRVAQQTRAREILLGAALLLASVLFFLFAPARLVPLAEGVFMTPGAQALAARDQFLAASVRVIQRDFDPQTTAVLGVSQIFHHPDYYLRAFKDYRSSDLNEKRILLPPQIRTLVIFGNPREGDWKPPTERADVQFDAEGAFYYLPARADERIFIGAQGYGLTAQ